MKFFGSEKAKKLSIFKNIDGETVDEILTKALRESFSAGESIMLQNDHPNGKGYIIEEGSVDVFVNDESTAKLTAGDMFGEIALLNEEPRSASVVAEDDVTLIILSQDTLFEMIENDDNSINKEIMRRMEENLEAE